MSEQNALIIPSQQSKYVSTEVVKELSKGGGWLPRIQVTSGMSQVVTDGKIGVGRIASISGKNCTDYGLRLVAFILSWRPKVARYSPETTIVYNPENPLFKDIRDRALEGGQNNPNQFGPEFLVWLPEQKSLETFFHGSTSLRNEGNVGIGVFNKQAQEQRWVPVVFEIDLIKSKKNGKQWHITRISEYAGTVPDDKLPPMLEVAEQLEKFNNPKDDEKEAAEPVSAGRD